MKQKFIFLVAISVAVINFRVFGINQLLDAAHSNYVVIGAFAIQKNADKFIEDVKKLNFNAVSAINPNRKLYYVYVLHTADQKIAFKEANKIRKATPLSDTWVFSGLLGSDAFDQGVDSNPVTEKALSKVEISDVKTFSTKQENNSSLSPPSTSSDTTTNHLSPIVEIPASPVPTEPVPVADAEAGSKNFVFKIFTAVDKKEIQGDIDVTDIDRARKIATFKGNQNVVVRQMNKSGKLSLVCEVFGYRVVKKVLDFNKPQDTEGLVVEGNQLIIPFELNRLKKGDVAVMYSVYFYKDAAVMLPESRPEVTSLMEMMKENMKYKIRIHGHTNGNATGKIISIGESKKFFSLNDTKEGFGSAKKLSEERAEVIREFLTSGGIEVSRMEIKAWGGKHPIYDKESAQAQGNVRVEIEILADK